MSCHAEPVMSDRETGEFPRTRLRRMRRDEFSRRLMRESTLSADNLIYPMFVIEGRSSREPIAQHAGHRARHASMSWCAKPSRWRELDIPALALFPVTAAAGQEPRRQRSVESRRTGAARGARSQEGGAASSA